MKNSVHTEYLRTGELNWSNSGSTIEYRFLSCWSSSNNPTGR